MTVHPVGNGAGVSQPGVGRLEGTGGQDFEQLVRQFIDEAKGIEEQADLAVQQLVTGQTDSVHSVLLAVAQAEMAVRLVMEVRDRLIQTYQDLQRLQI